MIPIVIINLIFDHNCTKIIIVCKSDLLYMIIAIRNHASIYFTFSSISKYKSYVTKIVGCLLKINNKTEYIVIITHVFLSFDWRAGSLFRPIKQYSISIADDDERNALVDSMIFIHWMHMSTEWN